ncbi:TPA: hypothetical protein ACQGWB_003264 [Pseudomonas aeruginosa]|uniref:Uncharacterized protein n=1 Tax=Pseudomonas extremaustralis TaxID=359110 RepID=A0A5C5Q3W4_9PSED|nr:hypothetical protein [Pseudomonas extremaustralis]EZI24063.1 hypothetical protein PE143B_0128740 [Pseudomonas extremaustralis 14-3 substr. 14-3b]TWR99889.1 hypothetical protein FIV36_29105 [Pseudomonas extremaustralis]SDF56195.1 hypothetical protein SAMN05216591_3317 [Pseudomonas extremaustralis]
MTERTRYLTEGVRKFSPLLQAFEAGYTIEEVRAAVLEALQPEFRNTVVLDRYGIDLLTVEATNVSKLKQTPSSYELFRSCMSVRSSLLDEDHDRCAQVCSNWEQEIAAGLRFYWNSARLEVNKDDLPIDEFAYEAFRNIGSLLEATMLPYLRELLHLHESRNGSQSVKVDILALHFGAVVNRLEHVLGANALRPQPWNIPLNQWRNIAQHFSIESSAAIITCRYGQGNSRTIQFTRADLWKALFSILSMLLAIRTSHTIFFMDHGNILASHCKGFGRKDSDLQFQFVVGAASQGFEVASLSVSPDLSIAVFKDCTTGEPTPRGIHASQFVLGLWQATKSVKVQIDYITKSGVRHLRASTLGSNCAFVDSGEREMEYLAQVVDLTLAPCDEA